jgi:hypothetical protein
VSDGADQKRKLHKYLEKAHEFLGEEELSAPEGESLLGKTPCDTTCERNLRAGSVDCFPTNYRRTWANGHNDRRLKGSGERLMVSDGSCPLSPVSIAGSLWITISAVSERFGGHLFLVESRKRPSEGTQLQIVF